MARILNFTTLRHLHGRHDELVTFADVLGPALHDGFLLGVETHTLFSIRVGVAKQTAFPAAKAVPRHRHRNGHVHTYHAHLNATRKFAGGMAVAGKARHTIAELVPIDQVDSCTQVGHMHAGQHRPEYLFFVDTHFR